MSNLSNKSVTEELLSILSASPIPLSTRDVSAQLRIHRLKLAGYEVGNHLRNLLNEGKVNFKTGRWTAPVSPEKKEPSSPATFPQLSHETMAILGLKAPEGPIVCRGWIKPDTEEINQETYSGRWGLFRKLLK